MARHSSIVKTNFIRLVAGVAVCLACLDGGYAQECPDPAPETKGSYSFRRVGDSLDIPITLADCQAITLELRWFNGRNNGSLFRVSFLDSDNRTLYTKQFSAFMSGGHEFPLTPVEFLTSPGSVSVVPVPALVTIQAMPPFARPANIAYTVTRVNRNPRPKRRSIDPNLATTLQTEPGRLLVDSPMYTLAEVAFNEPREIEIRGKRRSVASAFRLVLKDANSTGDFRQRIKKGIDLIWIDDAPLPAFRRGTTAEPEFGAIIYDTDVLRDGAEVSVSNQDGSEVYSLPERIKYQSHVQRLRSNFKTNNEDAEGKEGNVVVGMQSTVRVIGATRRPLVQIQMTTSRPFPARDSALRLQVGKRFFVNELSGDHTGRVLTLTLTPEMFADLKDGADIVAFFNRPDRSGNAGEDVWYFGKLHKEMLQANK